jgi:endonuclease/exonuclease/phosphatase family metal-dependent hydrolase
MASVRVMTRNLFLGADLTSAYDALASADGAVRLPEVVAEIFNPTPPLGLVQRTNFPQRAVALAAEIDAARPDLIGVQEAAEWRTRDATGEVVSCDHLAILESELARRRLPYRRAVLIENGDVELPSAKGMTVRLINRGAILVRDDMSLTNAQTAGYAATVPVATPIGTFPLTRGWGSVDAAIGDRTLRFITTHLEVASSPDAETVQRQQAGELVAGPAATPLPVAVAGDFNLRPGRPTYRQLRDAGFDDAWTAANPDGATGNTCCHGVSLSDPKSVLKRRIDLILTRGEIRATRAFVVGAEPEDFASGLWPSDHAGVVAELELTGMAA